MDASFDLDSFRRGFNIDITRYEGDDMEFEMKGVSCAVSAAQLAARARHARAVCTRSDWRAAPRVGADGVACAGGAAGAAA